MAEATWRGDPSRLDRVLPQLGLVRSRSQAAEFIAAGRVTVGGVTATKSGVTVAPESLVSVEGSDHYVSRAAHKLIAGLDAFGVDPSGALALDAGASTGGFTQVLLERGARQVLAIDVGRDQLAPQLREDSRVRLVEGCNVRSLDAEQLATLTGVNEPPSLVVADLSFISLELVLPALVSVATEDAQLVLLVKPQFEVGRGGIQAGIVTDLTLAAEAVIRVMRYAADIGLRIEGAQLSPLAGEHGNREVLVHLVRGVARNQTEWEKHIHSLFEEKGGA